MHEQLAGYIAGPVNAEDLAVAPGGEWVLTSGMTGPTEPLGRLYAIRVEDGACSEIFPYGTRPGPWITSDSQHSQTSTH